MTTNQMIRLFAQVIDGIPPNAESVIRRHYGLNRKPTMMEIRAEIENLQRKRKAGTLDTRQEHLAAALNIA